MARPKKPRGRPVKQGPPQRIPDTKQNIVRALLKTRTKPERNRLKGKAASGP